MENRIKTHPVERQNHAEPDNLVLFKADCSMLRCRNKSQKLHE